MVSKASRAGAAVATSNTASTLAFPTDAGFNPATLLQERPDS
jgi:hypothetical protein